MSSVGDGPTATKLVSLYTHPCWLGTWPMISSLTDHVRPQPKVNAAALGEVTGKVDVEFVRPYVSFGKSFPRRRASITRSSKGSCFSRFGDPRNFWWQGYAATSAVKVVALKGLVESVMTECTCEPNLSIAAAHMTCSRAGP